MKLIALVLSCNGLIITSNELPIKLLRICKDCQIFGSQGWGGGVGGVLWLSQTYLGSFFGFKLLNFNIFGVYRKMNIFGGMNILWYFLGVITYLGVISMHFSRILKVKLHFGSLKFQIFFGGAWNSWYVLEVNGRCWAQAYVYRKNESTPPLGFG